MVSGGKDSCLGRVHAGTKGFAEALERAKEIVDVLEREDTVDVVNKGEENREATEVVIEERARSKTG